MCKCGATQCTYLGNVGNGLVKPSESKTLAGDSFKISSPFVVVQDWTTRMHVRILILLVLGLV